MLRLTPTYHRSSRGRKIAVITLFIITGGCWTILLRTANMTFKAFMEPVTIEHVKPVYHSWGDLGRLVNAQYESAGKKITNNLPMHEFLSNGLLEVNLEGPHPIYQLIEFSEKKWKAKLQRASKTLDEAVTEYERRYRRAPPRGFDKWWVFPLHFSIVQI